MNTRSVVLGVLVLCASAIASGNQIDISGPAGSVRFGTNVYALPNGNLVVTDPDADNGRGAVHLYTRNGTRISSLRGSSINDHVGTFGIVVLPNGNFLVRNPSWNNGAQSNAGAVTWVNGATGLDGVVSAQNSLVGTHAEDRVGSDCTVLGNGNYLVRTEAWDRPVAGGVLADAGAVTWGSGTNGVRGPVSELNSLVGRNAGELLGAYNVVKLSGGDVVVPSPLWTGDASHVEVGAVLRMSGTHGASGELGPGNALLGARSGDRVGTTVLRLASGNYYVGSDSWSDGTASVGSLTWCSGTAACLGTVSATNSLIGSKNHDMLVLLGKALPNGKLLVMLPYWDDPVSSTENVGAAFVLPDNRSVTGRLLPSSVLHGTQKDDSVGSDAYVLSNGNAVVVSRQLNDGAARTGAATWIDVDAPAVGPVTEMNSLLGNDATNIWVVPLHEGRYVVACPYCDINGVVDAGAAVWAGDHGAFGRIGSHNALYGYVAYDKVGSDVTVLTNGNYVVRSPDWDRSILFPNTGAVTWVDGATGVPRNESTPGIAVSSNNSLVGTLGGDAVGISGVFALSNGNYVVSSRNYKHIGAAAAGAVTWAPGNVGMSGNVDLSNSLVGASPNDAVGTIVKPLPNGNFVVGSPNWDERLPSGTVAADAGALTWVDGSLGLTGLVSKDNSFLSNGQDGSNVGYFQVLSDGNYVVSSYFADRCDSSGCVPDTGAWTPGFATSKLLGRIDARNSVLGTVALEGGNQTHAFNAVTNQLVVGRPAANLISLFERSLFAQGFE